MTPLANWRSTISVWGLALDGELLFVGDAGLTEPSSPSRRLGVAFANFHRPLPSLALDLDVSLARARFRNVAPSEDRIPGAIENVIAGGVTWSLPVGPFGSLRVRHFGAYPLIEDNRVRAMPTTLLGAEAGYRLASGLRVQATILNLLNNPGQRHSVLLRLAAPGRGGRRRRGRPLSPGGTAPGADCAFLGLLAGCSGWHSRGSRGTVRRSPQGN